MTLAQTLWAVVEDRMHRLDPDTLAPLCGEQGDPQSRPLDRESSLRIVRTTPMLVCGQCDRVARRLRREQQPGWQAPRERKLSPEQQEIRDRLDEEGRRREKNRDAEARVQKSRSTSVRTVGGGLPTLGRRRK